MRGVGPASHQDRFRLARRIAARRRFHRMLARQQINLESASWREVEEIVLRAVHACSHCREVPACSAWLAGAEPPLRYLRFCPNAEAIETLRIMAS